MSHKRSIAPGPIHSNSLSVRVKLSLNNNDGIDSDNEIGPFRQNASASSTTRYSRDFDEKLPNIQIKKEKIYNSLKIIAYTY